MLLFWVLAVLVLATTIAVLLWPLLRKGAVSNRPDTAAAAIAVYRDQKRSLDNDFASGELTSGERDAAVGELARRVAEDVEGVPTTPARTSRRAWGMAIALLLLIPSAAIVLYARLGNPAASVVTTSEVGGHQLSDQQIAMMVDSLAQRLKQHPEDGNGWVLLARSYQTLERFPEAADAYAHANALIPDDPSLLADYADTLAVAQGRRLGGEPAALIQRALSIDPKHKKALALAATVALETRDLDASLVYWRRLAAELAAGSDEARQVADVIAEVEGAKRDGKDLPVQPARVPTTDGTTPQNSVPVTAGKAVAAGITGRVDLAPALASRVALTDTVFIFARASEGSRMPLAVLRIPAKDLPKDFSLDDSMSMSPAMKLSGASSVIVEARVSKSGNAIAQSGDLFGKSARVTPGTKGLSIIIDQVVP